MVSFHSTVGHSYETIYILSRNMAIYQKGQLKSVQLMVQLQHFGDYREPMVFSDERDCGNAVAWFHVEMRGQGLVNVDSSDEVY